MNTTTLETKDSAALIRSRVKSRKLFLSSHHALMCQRLGARIHEALTQLVRVYQFRDRDRICRYDVSVTQCYAVEALVKQGPLRLQALAEQMFLDKSTASRVVDTLERKGYVSE
jgi:hypothetical protein